MSHEPEWEMSPLQYCDANADDISGPGAKSSSDSDSDDKDDESCPDYLDAYEYLDSVDDSLDAASVDEGGGKSKTKRLNAKLYRYGNSLCGKRADLPAHPDIPTLRFFKEVWRTCRDVKDIKLRKWMPFSKCNDCFRIRTAITKCRDPQKKSSSRSTTGT